MPTAVEVETSDPKQWLDPGRLMRIRAVPIAYAGEFVSMSGRKVKLTEEKLRSYTRETFAEGDHIPHLHHGHPNSLFMPQQPGFGQVEKIYYDGKYLLADYVNLRPWDAQDILSTGRFFNRSVEIGPDSKGKEIIKAVGHLGSSSPAITGMPQIRADQCSWMEPAEYGFSAPGDDPETMVLFSLEGGQESEKETTMPEISEERFAQMESQLSAALQGIDALKAEKDSVAEKFEAEKQARVKLEESLKASQLEAERSRFEAARVNVMDFCNRLHQGGALSAGHMDSEGINLPALMLHVKLHCPDISIGDKEFSVYERLQEAFAAYEELMPRRGDGFSQHEDTKRAPQTGSDDAKLEAEIKRLQSADPKLSYSDALMQALGGGQ